eukprot:m.139742 g.139742  ORF g.139742 m.139742 type:complete len:91 (+) comp14810_c0_seq1:178-450(+)
MPAAQELFRYKSSYFCHYGVHSNYVSSKTSDEYNAATEAALQTHEILYKSSFNLATILSTMWAASSIAPTPTSPHAKRFEMGGIDSIPHE